MVVHVNKAYETATGWKGWDEDAAAADAPLVAEGFQGAVAAATGCGETATTGFPVDLGFLPTSELYERVYDPVQMNIQYGSSTNPPKWTTSVTGPLVIDFTEATPTTIIYGSEQNQFTLDMIQIVQATHNNWLLSNKTQNQEDIVFFFKKGTASSEEYIFIVIPLIKSTAYTTSNRFLQAIYTPGAQGPFTIRDCFPADNTLFLQYSTCLQASAGGIRNAHVFVSSVGLAVSEGNMRGVFNTAIGKRACIDQTNSTFCQVLPPSSINSSGTFDRGTGQFTKDSNIGTGFLNKVRSTRGVVKRESTVYSTSSQVIRADQTGSYKCLPFNPDSEVKDDKIRVDLETGLVVNDVGEPLSNVLEARAKIIAQEKGPLELKPGNWEKYMTYALAGIFAVFATALMIYLVIVVFRGGGAAAAVAPAAAVAVAATGSP